jgi:hypothetical protein
MTFPRRFLTATALASVFSVCLASAPGLAFAQDDKSATETAAARSLAIEGLKLAQAGNCSEAIDKLERSEKLRHSPIVLGKLGECLVNLGKLVEGTEALRRMLREPLPPDPTPALQQAYERAQAALDSAKPRLAGLTINVKAPSDAKVSVTVDGEPVPAAVVGVELPADPGEHVIEATAPGYLKASTRARMSPGEKSSVSLELERDPNAPPPGAETDASKAAPAAAQAPAATDDSHTREGMSFDSDAVPHERASNAPAYIAYGVGAVGLGVGIGFGLAAMSAKNDLDCKNDLCPPEEEDRLDSAKLKGTLSTIGFALGGAGIALGTILVISNTGSSEASQGRHRGASAPGLRYRAAIGPGQIKAAIDF